MPEQNMENRIYSIEEQYVDLSTFQTKGKILDIGGGGEGIMGQLFGERVVAIDLRAEELEEAPAGPLKIVMDATDLKFLDHTFDTVTIFFTLLYISTDNYFQVLQEAQRILKPGGDLFIWDVVIPKYPGGEKDIFLAPLKVKLQEKVISTSYGTHWPAKEQNLAYLREMGEKIGLKIVEENQTGETYYLHLQKV